jgi:hypothetical protein
MPKFLRHTLLILIVIIMANDNLYAQAANNYPVDVTPILTPPYKLNIAEYASNSAFLKLQLRLKDLTKSSVDVYFKMQISTIGISIRTRDDFKPLKTEKLFAGELKTLTGPDLAEYFRPENLIVDGLDPAILYAGGKLPSGLYTFTFTAYETDRDRQVSNVGTALMTVFLGLPPLITSPQQDQLLTPTDPQAVLFQWLPRATAAPTGFSSTVYQIRIFRIDQTNAAQTSLFVEANQTALSQDPIFVGQSNSPNFLYNPLQPAYFPLIPGEVYAIQVQATNPIANENTYENNGYSQVVSFRYGAKCLPPTAFTTSLKDLGTVTLSWQAAEAAQSYDVRYRLSGTSLWQNKSIYGNSITLPLLADGNYEYQIMSNCGVGTQSSWGENQNFTLSNGLLIENKATYSRQATAAANQTNNTTTSSNTSNQENELLDRVMNPLANPVSSGSALSQADIDSFFEKVPRPKCAGVADKTVSCDVNTASYTGTPKDLLQVGDKIVINNYEVLLSEVSGSAGTFSGRGIAEFPFLKVRFPVVFSNISVVGAPEGTDPLTQEQGGCVSAGEIAVEGSDAGLLDRDVQTRLQNLYNKANNPDAFSGNFKEAIEAAKKMAAALLDSIAKGKTPTPAEIGKYKNICKALNAGIEAWKQDIVKAIPAPVPAEITQLITDLDTYKSQLQDILNCNGQGYLRFGQKRDALYANTLLGSKELYFEPCLNAEKLKIVKAAAEGAEVDIKKIKKNFWPKYYKKSFDAELVEKSFLYEMSDEEDAESEVGNIPIYVYKVIESELEESDISECGEEPKLPNTLTPAQISEMYYMEILQVDMTNCPANYKGKTTYTRPTNIPRNKAYYFDMLLEKQNANKIPKLLSTSNRQFVIEGKYDRIIIDEDWIKVCPKHKQYLGDGFHHHHIDRLNSAVALPKKFHQDFNFQLHWADDVLEKVGKYCTDKKLPNNKGRVFTKGLGAVSIIFTFLDIASAIKGDPTAGWNIYANVSKKGKLYYLMEKDIFLMIYRLNINEDDVEIAYTTYTDYDYNKELKKYVGVNPIGNYTEKFNKKTKQTYYAGPDKVN